MLLQLVSTAHIKNENNSSAKYKSQFKLRTLIVNLIYFRNILRDVNIVIRCHFTTINTKFIVFHGIRDTHHILGHEQTILW